MKLGIFANGIDIGVDMWVHLMICYADMLSLGLMHSGISCFEDTEEPVIILPMRF